MQLVLTVTDILGATVYSVSDLIVNDTITKEMDLSALPHGVYYLHVISVKGYAVEKLVIR